MSKRNRSPLVGVLSAVFLYCLAGFLVLPGVALHLTNQQLEQRLNVPARLQGLEFNPLSFQLTLHRLDIGPAEDPLVHMRRLDADFQLSTLWSDALELDSLRIERVAVAATLQASGTLDLSQLLKVPAAQPEPDEKAAAPFPVRIAHLQVSNSRLLFKDNQPTTPVRVDLDQIQLDARHVSTLPDEHSELSLQAQGPAGASLMFQGTLGITPLASSGTLQLADLPLAPFWPYVRDQVPLELQQGSLDAHAAFELNLAEGADLTLSNSGATLSSFSLKSPTGAPLAQAARLHLEDLSLDLRKRSLRLGVVRGNGLEAWVERTEDGQLNWQTRFTGAAQTDQAASPDTSWRVRLADLQLRNNQVHLLDRQPQRSTALTLGALDLDLSGLDTAGNTPFRLRIDTQLNGTGHLRAAGQAQLTPPSLDLEVDASGVDLQLAQAYIDPFVRMNIRSGLLSTSAQVRLQRLEPLELHLEAEAAIADLHIVDSLEKRDLLRWESLALSGISYHDGSLAIDQAALLKPYARLIINQDLSTNLGELMINQPSGTEPADRPGLAVRIGAIDLEQGSLNFADFSLLPNVAVTLEELTGRVGTLDNRSTTPAEINLSGQVDRYAPVKVTGTLTPFDPLNSLDVEASFRDIELTTLSPYARKFAGYRIRKGRLDLDLHYQITQGELQAENKVLLRDLQLGERVESPDAVNLPVRLAIALLKDSRGNIDITLPVRGDLNNPDINVMPLIWQALGNLLTRAATAPFRFIGNLLGDNDVDLSQVLFDAGSAKLDGPARQQLDALASALQQRPALRLEVEARSDPATEGLLVAQQRLERELKRRTDRLLEGTEDATETGDGLSAGRMTELLETIYLERLKQDVPGEWATLEPETRHARLREAITATWNGNEALLRRLAQERNQSIKAYLVDNTGLPAQRVQLLDAGIEAVAVNGQVPTTLHLGVE